MPLHLEQCIEQLYRGEMLSEATMKELCERMKELLMNESNVLSIKSPVTVVGDVHGQFFDVLELFKVGGRPPDTNYLFLGDYVDRGRHSVETISLLLCLKLRWPERISLLRGNHESRAITQTYGFYAECVRKYGSPFVWKQVTDVFDYLSLAAVIDSRIFAVHGGLSPAISTIDQIRVLDRFQEVPMDGPTTDLLWSDPEPDREGFSPSMRGAGYLFGADVVAQFMGVNGIDHITRAHQLAMDGYMMFFGGRLSTVWSAPNYCYRCGNVAAIMEVADQSKTFSFNTFSAAPDNDRPTGTGSTTDLKETPDYFV